mmetsp:Transcript_40108/g.94237  ORF Transcript_40108/g.94237 Transcript_40108/m.94237 type:complete len:489 (+) Transcript_40108:402-1868(+)
MQYFDMGALPLRNGVNLGVLLADLLQCKSDRLRKKFTHAKLYAHVFERTTGKPPDVAALDRFERAFIQSVGEEQSKEVAWNVRRQWMQYFCAYCEDVGQPIETADWDASVDKIEQGDNEKRPSKKLRSHAEASGSTEEDTEFLAFLSNEMLLPQEHQRDPHPLKPVISPEPVDSVLEEEKIQVTQAKLCAVSQNLGPYLLKVLEYVQTYQLPFEYCEVWMPMPTGKLGKKHLRIAGNIVNTNLLESGRQKEFQNLHSFGEYSRDFHFSPGFGVPGRVFESQEPVWDQSVNEIVEERLFPRKPGAQQWGVRTAVGFPICSPTFDFVVVAFYTCNDVTENDQLIHQVSQKLYTIFATPPPPSLSDRKQPSQELLAGSLSVPLPPLIFSTSASSSSHAPSAIHPQKIQEIVTLLGGVMPTNTGASSSVVALQHLPCLLALRLQLLRDRNTVREGDVLETIVRSYDAYRASGRDPQHIAVLLASEYEYMSKR